MADALENPETPLRVEVGRDAAMVLELRRTLSDAEFEATHARGAGVDLVNAMEGERWRS